MQHPQEGRGGIPNSLRSWEGWSWGGGVASTSEGSSPAHSFTHSFFHSFVRSFHCVPDAQMCRDMVVTQADWVPTFITSRGASHPQIWEQTPCLVTGVQSRQWTLAGHTCLSLRTSPSILETLTRVAQHWWPAKPLPPRGWSGGPGGGALFCRARWRGDCKAQAPGAVGTFPGYCR